MKVIANCYVRFDDFGDTLFFKCSVFFYCSKHLTIVCLTLSYFIIV
jgi:hypothetical protein